MSIAFLPAADVECSDTQPRPEAQVRRDLTKGLAELAAKRADIDLSERYWGGDHPKLWLTDRLRRVFDKEFAGRRLGDNFCRLVIEAAVQRLEILGWEGVEIRTQAGALQPGSPEEAEAVWDDNDLDGGGQEELWRLAGYAGEAYVIVWPRDPGPGYDVAVNDPRLVHIEFASRRRSDRSWATKVWHDGAAWRANVYYPDEVVRFVTDPMKAGSRPKEERFRLDPDDAGGPHDFGAVPVVRFAQAQARWSRLADVIPVQDKINKLGINKMVTAESLAFPQRYILTADETLKDDTLRAGPGAFWRFDPGGAENEEGKADPPTKVGQFDAADLSKYDGAIDSEVDKLFTIAPLPKHMRVNPGAGGPSGDAIKADEGPFVAMVKDLQQLYGASTRDVMALCGLNVAPVWGDPEVHNIESQARSVLALVQAGVPVTIAVARVARWTDIEVAELEAAVKAVQAQQASAGAAALRAADQGRDPAELVEGGA